MTKTLVLPQVLQRRIMDEARAAFPRECCGLLEGVRDGDAVQVHALHAARNLSCDDDHFEIDPADHFAALRSARAAARQIVGCYHSHPNGRAEPSAHDGGSEDGFVWLIAATTVEAATLAAFQRDAAGWRTLDLRGKSMEKAA